MKVLTSILPTATRRLKTLWRSLWRQREGFKELRILKVTLEISWSYPTSRLSRHSKKQVARRWVVRLIAWSRCFTCPCAISSRELWMPAKRVSVWCAVAAVLEGPAKARFRLICATLAMCAPANDRSARCELFSWNVGFSRQQILFSVSRYN